MEKRSIAALPSEIGTLTLAEKRRKEIDEQLKILRQNDEATIEKKLIAELKKLFELEDYSIQRHRKKLNRYIIEEKKLLVQGMDKYSFDAIVEKILDRNGYKIVNIDKIEKERILEEYIRLSPDFKLISRPFFIIEEKQSE